MRKIFEDLDMTMVGYFESILNENGIETLIKNVGSSMLMAEMPIADALPELWVVDDSDYGEALRILEPFYRTMKDTRQEVPLRRS